MNTYKDYIQKILNQLLSDTDISAEDIPNIDLYMDQVTTFMESHLANRKRTPDEKIMTKTMINNYAKNDLLPPPVKKKYSKNHMILLIFIYYLKNMLSINDIQILLAPLADTYFDNMGTLSLQEVYTSIQDIYPDIKSRSAEDIMYYLDASSDSFSGCRAADEKEFLQLFSFISYLSHDIYIKKRLLERTVDCIRGLQPLEAREKKGTKKKEKKKKPDTI